MAPVPNRIPAHRFDGFKAINDTYGHDCGDQVLRRIGELMRVGTRPDDVAIRHGGDELAGSCCETSVDDRPAAWRGA